MATHPAIEANLAAADALLARLHEHVEGGDRANDLQLVALTAQALATVALAHAVHDLTETVIRNA